MEIESLRDMNVLVNSLKKIFRLVPASVRLGLGRLYFGTMKLVVSVAYPRPRPKRLPDGTVLMLDPRHRWIDFNLVLHGHYEPGTLSLIRKLLRPGETFLDIGANIGLMSIAGGRSVGKNGHVYAFEPDSINFGRLAWARQANKLPNVMPLPIALGSEQRSTALHRSPSADGGLSSLKEIDGFVAGEMVSVNTLDSLASALCIENVKLIKIDVEGSELDVVRGSIELIERERPAIILEMVNDASVEAGKMLLGLGYLGFLTEGKGAREIETLRQSEPHLLTHDNMLFVHRDNCSELHERGLKVQIS